MIDLSKLETIGPLKRGKHANLAAGACVMEAAAFVAGEPWSDQPKCVCPVIGTFLRAWNDALPTDDDRDRLLKPLVPKIINTRAGAETEKRRSYMALDWLIRVNLPAWLRMAKLDEHADAVAALQPLLSPDAAAAAQPVLDAARAAAMYAAWDAAWDAAWEGAREAAWDAAWDAAWEGAREAACAFVRVVAWDAARGAASFAALDAAGGAAQGAYSATVADLQLSAVDLVERMSAITEEQS